MSVYGAEDRPPWKLHLCGRPSPRGAVQQIGLRLGAAASSLGVCGEWWALPRKPASPSARPGGSFLLLSLWNLFFRLLRTMRKCPFPSGQRDTVAAESGSAELGSEALSPSPHLLRGLRGGHPRSFLIPRPPSAQWAPAVRRVQLGSSLFVT